MSEKFDRFDLESAINNCWSIIDDLRSCDDEYVKALTVVYERKFELLWRIFETMVVENKQGFDMSKVNFDGWQEKEEDLIFDESFSELTDFDLRKKFEDYFYDGSDNSTSERFNKAIVFIQEQDNLYFAKRHMQKWLEAAFIAGAKSVQKE